MPRSFNGAGDQIVMSVGANAPTTSDVFLFAALCRRDVSTTWHGIFSINQSGPAVGLAFEFDNVSNSFVVSGAGGSFGDVITTVGSGYTGDSKWLLVTAFAQGGSAITLNIFDVAAGTWNETNTTTVTGTAITATELRLGKWVASDDYDGDIAWVAFWSDALPSGLNSSTEVQHFFAGATIQQIISRQPSYLFVLDGTQDIVNLMGDGAKQTSITGTAQSTNAPYGLTGYGHTIAAVTVDAPAGAASVTPGIATLTLTAFAPTVTATANQTLTPGTASLALTARTPTATVNTGLTPGTATLALTAFAPSVVTPTSVTPGTATLTLTAFTPAVTTGASSTLTPGLATLALAAFAPTVTATANQSLTPGIATLTLTAFAPTVTATANQTLTPGVATLTLTALTPTATVSSAGVLTPGSASLTLTAFAPTVTVTTNAVLTPGTAALTLTRYAPVVSTPVAVTPGVAALILAGLTPTVTTSSGVTVTPTTAALVLTAYAPSVAATGQAVIRYFVGEGRYTAKNTGRARYSVRHDGTGRLEA